MARRARWKFAVALGLAVAMLAPGAVRAGDSAPLAAAFDYAMPSRFEVPPLPDDSAQSPAATFYFSGPVKPAHWRVNLDACASTGPIASYEWQLDGAPLATLASCAGAFFEVDEEGVHEVTLRVHDGAAEVASMTRAVRVQDWLVIGLGDSYGSGEGNPDQPVTVSQLDALSTAQAALAAAEQALTARLADYALAQQNLDELVPLVLTAQARYSAWLAAAADVDANCGNLTPILCAQAEAAFAQAGAQLVAALVPLGLDSLFGSPTLLGVLSDLRSSAEHALDLARAARDAALAARDAASASLADALAQIHPRWEGRQCHRSASAGQVQAAKRLEDSDPHTSVSFIHLACSGAKIWKGLLGSYEGIEQVAPEPDLEPQVDAAAELVSGREVDALVVSIGGNDVKFADVIETCATKEPCFDDPAPDDPTLGPVIGDYCAPLGPLSFLCTKYFDELYAKHAGSANRIFLFGDPLPVPDDHRLGLDDLPANYDALESRLESLASTGGLPGLFAPSGDARVYLTAYPGITRREPAVPSGPTQPCGFDPLAPLADRLKNLPGLSLAEVLWAESVVVPDLSGAMQSSALRHHWRFVDEHVASFDGHGYCADANWIERIPESIRAEARPSYGAKAVANAATGTAHPNALGHQAYASAIFGALLCDFYPGCDSTAVPRAPRLLERRPIPGTLLVVRDNASRPALRRISLVANGPLVATPQPGPGDPTQRGAILHVSNRGGTDDLLLTLPALGWKGLGRPAGALGYRYADPRRQFGPCTSVIVRRGRSIAARCSGATIPFTLDEPAQESVSVSLTLGDATTQCMEFGGTVQLDRPAVGKRSGVFQARRAPAPAICPAF
jgi:hypothetical protein